MTPDHRDALFLRMAELLQGYSPFLFDSNQRAELQTAWAEIAPSVEYEVRMIQSVEA
jgi:hypothetical protein